MKKKETRGGARIGAGRPPNYPSEGVLVKTSVSLPRSLLKEMDIAVQEGRAQSRSALLAKAAVAFIRLELSHD